LNPQSKTIVVKNLTAIAFTILFGVVDSSCWFVDVHCKWFQFSSEEPVLTEISTVTGANNFLQYPLNMKYFIKVFLFANLVGFYTH
jgi:hypothetical protein